MKPTPILGGLNWTKSRTAGVRSERQREIDLVGVAWNFTRFERLAFDPLGQHEATRKTGDCITQRCSDSEGIHYQHPGSGSCGEAAVRMGDARVHQLPAIRDQSPQLRLSGAGGKNHSATRYLRLLFGPALEGTRAVPRFVLGFGDERFR